MQLPQLRTFNPAAIDAQIEQEKSAQMQNKLAELALGQKQQEIDQSNALSDLYKSSVGQDGRVDRTALLSGAAQRGLGNQIPGLQKTFADQDKSQRDAEKAQLESAAKSSEIVGQYMTAAKQNPAMYPQIVAQLRSIIPGGGKDLPEQFDAAVVDATIQRAMSVKDQVAQALKAKEFDLNVEKFGYQQQNDAANRSVTVRGQNLTNARGVEANNLKAQENSINEKGIVGKKVQDVELKLQDDYRTESKGFSETSTAMKKILGAIDTADKNPGSALAAGTAFMKLLDPNSVVRESELGMALNASGWFDRATNITNQLQNGRIMTETQKTNLKAAAQTLFDEAKAAQREVDAAYAQRAKAYGADPTRVIVDRGQNVKAIAVNAPQGAVDMLKKNPSLRTQFDAKYGQGASDSVLKGK